MGFAGSLRRVKIPHHGWGYQMMSPVVLNAIQGLSHFGEAAFGLLEILRSLFSRDDALGT